MGKINVLDKHIAELIAAGEVVERPASVIKELVENSVDAGSTAVTVEIQNGGVSFMRVTDNGCGIAREDVPVAFLRHATSKISGGGDLDSISTLGFRGEALASVAAVAHVEMLTRTREELAGTHYAIDGDGEQDCADAGCAQGTTILVRDLFYNTPARMKFLKKDSTEGNTVAAIMDKTALSHPEISFRLLRDGRETLHTPGDGQLKSAVYAVFGKEFTAGLIPVDYELGGVKITGFVSKPSAARPNRSMQNFFINGRTVRSRTAMVALEEAFKGSLMTGKVPACVLHLVIPFEAVDVNVHPSKTEVRFVNERPIFDAVYHGVKAALSVGDAPAVLKLSPPAPQLSVLRENPVQTRVEPVRPGEQPLPQGGTKKPAVRYAVCDVEADAPAPLWKASRPETVRPEKDWLPRNEPEVSSLPEAEEPAVTFTRETERYQEPEPRLVGEAFATYMILERGDELVFIDKHAAHERLLYEKLRVQGGEACRQMLLEPVPVTLDKNEYSAVLDSLDVFEKAGFEIEDFGSGTVLVRSAPMILSGGVAESVMEIAGYLAENRRDVTTEKVDWLYHNVACRAAVKGGDNSSPRELLELALRVEREDVRYCPHGRPVSIIMKRKDLERQFGRIQ